MPGLAPLTRPRTRVAARLDGHAKRDDWRIQMKCPVCEVDLLMSERQGIEIDYCPKCRGVWLDRGELDKIIERADVEYGAGAAAAAPRPQGREAAYDSPPAGRESPGYSEPQDHRERERYHDHHGQDRDYDPHYDKHHKKKKSSFLGEIFEGFGGE
jgi:Zn-finger nucleic acid-binding protein